MHNVLNSTLKKFAAKNSSVSVSRQIEREVSHHNRQFAQAGVSNNMSERGNKGRNREWKGKIERK